MLKILFLLSTNFISQVIGQTRVYHKIEVPYSNSHFETDSLLVNHAYNVDNLEFLIGNSLKETEKNNGFKMIVRTRDNNVIFESPCQQDSYIFRPTFYRTDKKNDPILLFMEIGTEYSWGNYCYRLKDQQITELGFIDLAAYDTTEMNPDNCMDYAIIQLTSNQLKIEFNAHQLVTDPGGEDEKFYLNSEIYYLCEKEQLILMKH